jgi:hypothetical protein
MERLEKMFREKNEEKSFLDIMLEKETEIPRKPILQRVRIGRKSRTFNFFSGSREIEFIDNFG